MTDRPILFSTPMVRALLAGTKTQTRRVVKMPQDAQTVSLLKRPLYSNSGPELLRAWFRGVEHGPFASFEVTSPYGQPGDRLWVREAWRAEDWFNGNAPRDIPVGANLEYEAGRHEVKWPAAMGKLRPSMFMPRWASRITLNVTGVRVERLQDISEGDAMDEGAEPILVPPDGGSCPHVEGFRALWESINGAESWDENPWVWVVEFEKAKA